jgi:hypothetical protein
VVNTARLDATVFAALGFAGRMSNPLERLLPDSDGKVRHAAGREAHFAMTIQAGRHIVDASSLF